jgi:hypothetical protein
MEEIVKSQNISALRAARRMNELMNSVRGKLAFIRPDTVRAWRER